MHAFNCKGSVVLEARDMYVLFLMIYAFAFKGEEAMCCMEIDHKKYVNIGKIVQFLEFSSEMRFRRTD